VAQSRPDKSRGSCVCNGKGFICRQFLVEIDERLTPNHMLGAVLVVVGVLLLAKRNRT
jgi:hypothetical protein